jgi:hypothetical protein
MGRYTITLLKKLDTISEKEFMNSFMTYEEIVAYINSLPDSTTVKIKEQLKEMPKEKYEERVLTELKKFKETITQNDIDLTKISYVTYDYKERTEDGVTGIRGTVIFRHGILKYEVKASAFLIDGKYVPLIVRRLKLQPIDKQKN